MKRVITLPWAVPKKNSRAINTHTGRSFPNKRYRAWHSAAVKVLQLQQATGLSLGAVRPVARFFAPDRRTRDLTNVYQSVEDTFNDVQVWLDDNYFVQDCFFPIFMGVDKENPRIVVELIYGGDDMEFLDAVRAALAEKRLRRKE